MHILLLRDTDAADIPVIHDNSICAQYILCLRTQHVNGFACSIGCLYLDGKHNHCKTRV